MNVIIWKERYELGAPWVYRVEGEGERLIGAIIGDIVGSRFEFDNHRDKDFELFVDKENDGTSEHPIQMPYVEFHELVDLCVAEFYRFSKSHPEYQLANYGRILENNGIQWNDVSMKHANVNTMDRQCILSLIMGAIRAERFCTGALLRFVEDGYIVKWLKRLKALDRGM